MDRVHQGLAGSIFMIKPVEIVPADLKRRYSSGCILDPDAGQVTTLAQEKSTDEDIRGLVMPGDRSSPPSCSPSWIYPEKYDRKRISPAPRRWGLRPSTSLSPKVGS
jgi:hypothetical protein